MFRRDLRGSDTWCGLHNIVLLVMAGVMLMTAEVSAARVSNSFVTVEGRGIGITEAGDIWYDADSADSFQVTARSGWLVNGSESVTFTPSSGTMRGLDATSRLGEDKKHIHMFPCTVTNEHVSGFSVVAETDPSGLAAMYAVPDTSTEVSASASCKVVAKGLHRRTRTYLPCSCGEPGPSPETDTEEIVPDRYEWTATGPGSTVGLSTWTGELTKGLGQTVEFKVKASKSGCGNPDCHREASAEVKADVYELSIERPDYLGLDLTDAMKGRDVTRTATAKIDPAPASATYKWTSCGRCKFIGRKDAADVTYGGNDQTGGSESYLAEPLTVTATAKNAAGQSASATCMTNFTVVAVNVSVGGAGEDGEEENAKEVCYCKDNDDGSLKDFAKENLVPVRITCQPEDLPGIVELAPDSKYAQLFERAKGGSVTLAQTSYPCSEIGKEDFVLHGHSLPDGWWDKAISFFTTDSLTVTHADSGAVDKGAFKVVPPPPLQVTVNFSSPSGKWPYDPVWDNPAYEPTVKGKKAEWCADNPGEAKVAYMLSRDAADIKGKIYKSCGWYTSDDIVDSLKDMLPVKGVHISKWSLPKDLDIGTYYAKVTAVEGETGEERTAKSNEGELKRVCYYRSGASDDMIILSKWLKDEEVDGLKDGLDAVSASVDIATIEFPWWMSAIISTAKFLGIGGVDMPKWFTSGTEIRQCAWTVRKFEWNGESYVVPRPITTLLGEMGECRVDSSEFEIRYVKVGRPRGTDSGLVIDWHSWFYCGEIAIFRNDPRWELTVDGISNVIYPETSKEWKWEPKPGGGHGLLCPECCKENKED